jgi:hypothetical protein
MARELFDDVAMSLELTNEVPRQVNAASDLHLNFQKRLKAVFGVLDEEENVRFGRTVIEEKQLPQQPLPKNVVITREAVPLHLKVKSKYTHYELGIYIFLCVVTIH